MSDVDIDLARPVTEGDLVDKSVEAAVNIIDSDGIDVLPHASAHYKEALSSERDEPDYASSTDSSFNHLRSTHAVSGAHSISDDTASSKEAEQQDEVIEVELEEDENENEKDLEEERGETEELAVSTIPPVGEDETAAAVDSSSLSRCHTYSPSHICTHEVTCM
jgi:hypothetical protein